GIEDITRRERPARPADQGVIMRDVFPEALIHLLERSRQERALGLGGTMTVGRARARGVARRAHEERPLAPRSPDEVADRARIHARGVEKDDERRARSAIE